jgi:hypothetical protein
MNWENLEISYPSVLTQEERKFIFDSFRAEFPDEVKKWIDIEKGKTTGDEDPLRRISTLFRKYVLEKASSSSQMAISSLFFDMRTIIHKEL